MVSVFTRVQVYNNLKSTIVLVVTALTSYFSRASVTIEVKALPGRINLNEFDSSKLRQPISGKQIRITSSTKLNNLPKIRIGYERGYYWSTSQIDRSVADFKPLGKNHIQDGSESKARVPHLFYK